MATSIIPALKAAETTGPLLRVPRETVVEVILVDNGSADATGPDVDLAT